MTMTQLDQYKIEVVPGINDQPEPPNFEDNGKGCNGAYFIEKYNTLIDDVEESLAELEETTDNLGSAAFVDTSFFATAAQGQLAQTALQLSDASLFATAAQGQLAQTSLQSSDISLFATAAQGQLAETSLQPDDVSLFATAAQGQLAETAVQPEDIISLATAVQPGDIVDFENVAQLNDRDIANRNRNNHTGTQPSNTISDWTTALAGTANVTVYTPSANYHPATKKYVDDAIQTVVIGEGGYTDQSARDAIGGILSNEFTYQAGVPLISLSSISADKLTDGTTNKLFTSSEKNKLAGIATGATVNDLDDNLRNRGTHMGTQPISTIDGLQAALNSKEPANANILKTSNIGVTVQGYNANTVIDANYVQTQESYTTAEKNKLAGISTGATVNDTDANLRNRANHTGTQSIATVTNLQSSLDAKAPLASPTFTGTPTAPTAAVNTSTTQLATTNFVQTQIAARFTRTVTTVAALNIDCSLGNYFTKTISSNSTFTFSNPPTSGIAYAFTLELTHTSGTVTWPASVAWPGGTAPSLTTGNTHLLIFVTDDGGTRWRGAALVDYTN